LGRELVPRLLDQGYIVRVMSRHTASRTDRSVEWAQADLESGSGLAQAVAGVDTVVHAASSPFKRTWRVDVEGTRRLLGAARAAGVGHIAYISIVGIEHIAFGYYRAKVAAETLVREAGLPWSILRATQFYTLIDSLLRIVDRLPLFLLPTDFQIQPIDAGEAAARLTECVAAGPGGRLPDIGGPEVFRLGDMAQTWLAARQQPRRLVHLPVPGAFATAVRQGKLTCPESRYGRITWAEWLQKTDARPEVAAAS
jgi:uncharacterized protein YbjT (DUF2867 family)